MKLRSAARVIALPVAVVLRVAPAESVTSEVTPAAVTRIAPVEVIEPSEIDWASFKAKAPMVPLVDTAPMALAPVKLTVPAPLSASVAAVTTPAPFSVAPLATDVVAVEAPTFQLPDKVSVPAFTVVVPVWVFAPESVRVPAPDFDNESTPVPFCSAPAKLVELLSAPAVNVAAVPLLLVTAPPEPASEPTPTL